LNSTKESSGNTEDKNEYRIVSSIEMKDELSKIDDQEIRYMSRMPKLDELTEGFVAGELIVISGPTKHGKTLFAQSLTSQFTKQNAFPLWFSYEVTPKYFLRGFQELPLFYMPRKLKTNALDWVVGKCLESYKQYHTRIIFLDHLHYLFDMARVRSPSIEIGTVIRRLKSMAVEHGFVVFLLCHTTKGASDINTSYESIRDSSFVAQESDCVLMIRRSTEEGNRARLRVEFHRRTGVLEKIVHLHKGEDGYLHQEVLGEAKKHEKKPAPACPKCGKSLANEIKNRSSHCYNPECDADIRSVYEKQ